MAFHRVLQADTYAFVKSFNRKLRDACSSEKLFGLFVDAISKSCISGIGDDTARLYRSNSDRTPVASAAAGTYPMRRGETLRCPPGLAPLPRLPVKGGMSKRRPPQLDQIT